MLGAACCLGFFGFLHVGDVQADSLVNLGSFRIHMKCSQTDPFHQGCCIYTGAGKRDLCPVRALNQYLHVCGSTPGPLFLLSESTPLHRQWLTSSIQSILSTAGVPGCNTGHSFCIRTARSHHQDTWHMVHRCVSDLYSHSHQYYCKGSKPSYLTRISCISFSFPGCFCKVPRDFGSSGPGLPPALSPFPSPIWLSSESLRLGMGAHGWVAGICQPWGQYSI